jgi:hypothetical protein
MCALWFFLEFPAKYEDEVAATSPDDYYTVDPVHFTPDSHLRPTVLVTVASSFGLGGPSTETERRMGF